MLGTKGAFLIGSLLCFVMYLVLFSARANQVRGISDLLLANVLGMGAYILYAFSIELPPLFGYEGANALYAAASTATLVGYRHLFGRSTSIPGAAAAIAVLTGVIAVFHYVYDSFAARTLAVSLFQVAIALTIAFTVVSHRRAWIPPHYAYVFIVAMCVLAVLGHASRGVAIMFVAGAPTSLLEPSELNVVYLAVGAFMLPVLTVGGLLVAHRTTLAEAERSARIDFLTGAWSRRAFYEIAEREIKTARLHELAVLALDLDNFKEINDTKGHAIGDETLIRFVQLLQKELRAIDYLGRLGGDEFVVLMPNTTLHGAVTVAERLLAAVSNAYDGKNRLAFSIGVASLEPGDTLKSLLRRADVQMYEAKKLKRGGTPLVRQ